MISVCDCELRTRQLSTGGKHRTKFVKLIRLIQRHEHNPFARIVCTHGTVQ